MKLKVISWNIWGGKNLEEVARLLSQENPDIIGLQEVKEWNKDGQLENMAQVIAKSLGFNFYFYKAFSTDRHTPNYDLGNAIISRFPILDSKCHVLSDLSTYKDSAETEPRVALEANIDANGKSLTFVTTHIAYILNFLSSQIKEKQVNKLLNIIKDTNCILTGDFNSLPDSPMIKKIEEHLVHTDTDLKEPTWIGDDKTNKKFRIDYIFVSPDLKFNNFQILKSDASDHLPISVEIEI